MNSNNISKWEIAPVYIICAIVFLMPIFFAPTVLDPFTFGKSLVFYLLTIASLLAWLFVRLQDETINVPKSILLASFGGLAVASLVTAIFSSSRAVSLVGSGMEVETSAFFLTLFALMFLVSIYFQSEKRALLIYFAVFSSAIIVFIYQILHTVLKINIPGVEFLKNPVANTLGGWNDFGIFFGFVGIMAVTLFELVKLEKKFKFFLIFLALIALVSMVMVNFTALWFIFGFFALILVVYLFSGPALEKDEDDYAEGAAKPKAFARLSFFLVLLVIFFTMGNSLLKGFVNYLNANNLEVRPSWGATFGVVKQTYGESVKNIFLGSGPNTFVYDWAKFKPSFVNASSFWNYSFNSGVGHFPSMAATMGLLGVIAVLVFLSCLVYCGARVLSYTKNNLTRGLIFSSYLGALYLWTFIFFYTPGMWAFVLATVMTGVLIGLMTRAEKIETIKMSFLKNQRVRFVYVLFVVLLILGAIYSFSILVQKTLAAQTFSSGVRAYLQKGDLVKAETKLNQSVRLDPQDKYYRTISEFYLLKMRDTMNRSDISKEKQNMDLQKELGDAIDSAKAAVSLNKVNPENWIQLGRVYENLASIKIQGADMPAKESYAMAIKLSPSDPSLPLALARLELIGGNVDGARNYIRQSLKIKPDYVLALYLSSQIEVQQGNLKEAIAKSEQIVSIAPNDLGALFQLGLLYYQAKNYDGAGLALERAVAIDPYYSNARYFLGLVYEVRGLKNEALEQFRKISEVNPDNQEVKKIINNLESGRPALDAVSPPAPAPEKRDTPPVEDKGGKSDKVGL